LQGELTAEKLKVQTKDAEIIKWKEKYENDVCDLETKVAFLEEDVKNRDKSIKTLEMRLKKKHNDLQDANQKLANLRKKKEVEKKVLPKKIVEMQVTLEKNVARFKEIIDKFDEESEESKEEARRRKLILLCLGEVMKEELENFPDGLESFVVKEDKLFGDQPDGTNNFPPQTHLIVEGDKTKGPMREEKGTTVFYKGDVSAI
jgi:uncharacterized coiled-coil protein SlyX